MAAERHYNASRAAKRENGWVALPALRRPCSFPVIGSSYLSMLRTGFVCKFLLYPINSCQTVSYEFQIDP